jgi:hypothetical protein
MWSREDHSIAQGGRRWRITSHNVGTNSVLKKESNLSNRVRPNDLNCMVGSAMALPFLFGNIIFHTLIDTFHFETELQYFVLSSVVAEVWIKGCNINFGCDPIGFLIGWVFSCHVLSVHSSVIFVHPVMRS